MKEYDVIIIGLGKIGMGYDLNTPPSSQVFSHARAFERHGSFRLVAGVDPDQQRQDIFRKTYNCAAVSKLYDISGAITPSVVVVSTPTDSHYSVIQEVFKIWKPLAILCEKPLAFDHAQAANILKLCESNNCKLYVNYMRISDFAVQTLRQRIADSGIRSPVNGTVWYSKGLFNSASHFINLLQYFFGAIKGFRILRVDSIVDYEDPQADFEIQFSNERFYFLALNPENYFHNSMTLMAKNGRLRYERGGQLVTWESISQSELFSGYTTLSSSEEVLGTDFLKVQSHVVNQLFDSLSGKPANICNSEMAMETQNILESIRDAIRKMS